MDLTELKETFEFLDDWEDRYRFIIDLGKALPSMPDNLKTDANLVRGCQSQVWLSHQFENEKLVFQIDSDAHIVRGLIAVITTALADKSAEEINHFDLLGLFEELDLLNHLSPTRGNGLRAMVDRVRQTAAMQL